MVGWIKKIDWKKVLLVGVVYTVISFIIRQLEAVLTMKYYQMPEYYGVWSKVMMPTEGPPPASFFVTSLIFSLVVGMSLALIYYYVRDILPKNQKQRIFFFADLMIATYFIFFILPSYLMFNLPLALLVSWFISGFIILVFTSYALVKIIK